MSNNSTSSFSNPASRTDWVRIHQKTDADIDYSDSPAEDEAFWAEAEWWMPVSKTRLSLRLDSDVVDWFKAQGPGCQGRINAVLRAYVRTKVKA
ncbi:MAG: BrnA antitoxin family protein [Thermaerobacter sp.]|nr:BrnA antitoxin family protein [Thermaerobacter sp.]